MGALIGLTLCVGGYCIKAHPGDWNCDVDINGGDFAKNNPIPHCRKEGPCAADSCPANKTCTATSCSYPCTYPYCSDSNLGCFCRTVTPGTCNVFACHPWRNAWCHKHGPFKNHCECHPGFCSVCGRCVPEHGKSEPPPTDLSESLVWPD